MQIERIEIHTGSVDFAYTPVRALEAKCEATTAFSRTPSMEDVNTKLREMAASVGANAVINVAYKSGVTMTSWKSMKATGLAVKRESDETSCPLCAETVKRAAKKCRFCGADLAQSFAPSLRVPSVGGSQPWAQPSASSRRSAPKMLSDQEPLRSTDNPPWLIAGIVVAAIVLSVLASLWSY